MTSTEMASYSGRKTKLSSKRWSLSAIFGKMTHSARMKEKSPNPFQTNKLFFVHQKESHLNKAIFKQCNLMVNIGKRADVRFDRLQQANQWEKRSQANVPEIPTNC